MAGTKCPVLFSIFNPYTLKSSIINFQFSIPMPLNQQSTINNPKSIHTLFFFSRISKKTLDCMIESGYYNVKSSYKKGELL